jgi:ubiquinone/menaquinone biosynthesis C-methylase UbiE
MPGMELHSSGAWGFDGVAEAYEHARPTYPPEAVAWLAECLRLGPGATVVDLGAGTGKLTRALVATGARVIAVEPGEGMRRVLAEAVPDAEVLAGTAEAIPAPDASADAATAGQAAHWFHAEETIAELARVLRPGGGIAFIWNVRDSDDPLQAAVEELIGPFRDRTRMSDRADWEAGLADSGFRALERRSFRHVHELAADELPVLVSSYSFVAGLPAEERRKVLRRVRALAEGDRVRLAYTTQTFVSRRR